MSSSAIVSPLKERNIVMFIQYHCHENPDIRCDYLHDNSDEFSINLKTFMIRIMIKIIIRNKNHDNQFDNTLDKNHNKNHNKNHDKES